jgi:hypothetical protein
MSHDAIDSLAGFGYSEREAAFLYLVAVHSGYFLRRQFNQFVDRERGAIATHFLRKAIGLRHVAAMPCAEGRIVYHLADRKLYGLVGLPGSQGRRIKSPREVLRRLMLLDYVLLHIGSERFLETQQAKREFFLQMKVRPEVITQAEEFGHGVPISYVQTRENVMARLAFIDEGQRSSAMFSRFLKIHGTLMRALPSVETAYVAPTPAAFAQAAHVFERHMPLRNGMNPACPLGVDHLVNWLEVRHKFDDLRSSIAPSEHRLLLEGERIYSAQIHHGLIASWKNGAMNAEKVRKIFQQEAHRATLTTELLTGDYPRFLDMPTGYSAGYDDQHKSLFDNNVEEREQEQVMSEGGNDPAPPGCRFAGRSRPHSRVR